MGYYEPLPKKKPNAVVSVVCTSCVVEFDGAMGSLTSQKFGNGILRIYVDARRLEYKQHGGQFDGQVWGVPFDLIRNYRYEPARGCGEPLPDFA